MISTKGGENIVRHYKDWYIVKEGGFITIKRYEAEKFYDDPARYRWIWAFKLKDIIKLCDALDRGETVPDLYTKPLY